MTVENVVAQFCSQEGQTLDSINIPTASTIPQLNKLLNRLLENEEELPYSFFVNDQEITTDIQTDVIENMKFTAENLLNIVYHPQAVFRVRGVTRCSTSLNGHTEAVLSCSFSPDGSMLASGSGDSTVRFWDLNTETPQSTGKSHSNWVLCIAWSPDSQKLVSGSMDSKIQIWDKNGKPIGKPLAGHSKWITALAWQPLHLNPNCERFASSSRDGTVKVWDTIRRTCIFTFAQHTDAISCIKWGGNDWIYTASRDRTIKCWDASNGRLIKSLLGHAHWINTMALNTDSVLRTGAFDHTGKEYTDPNEAQAYALKRYTEAKGSQNERLVSGSDDFTLFLWSPVNDKKPICRMTGHQALINQVNFSPDGRIIASASFDKSIKLWNGFTGTFICNLRGHVSPVFQVCWSSDSRMLVSGSKDSTLKLWDMKTKKMRIELPGHLDAVYAVDWSPDGQRVASGSKDKTLKIWKQ